MADRADLVLYKDEFIEAFEHSSSILQPTATGDAETQGSQVTFIVANSNREAVTRGANGKIPASKSNYETPVATMQEYHDKEIITRFRAFTGQSDQRRITAVNSLKVIKRNIDDVILAELALGTQTITDAGEMSKEAASRALAQLGNNQVPYDDELFAVITPNQAQVLMDDPTYANADYVDVKPLVAGVPNPQAEGTQARKWNNIHWLVHPRLTGAGTTTAECYIYHRSAIGYCYDSGNIDAVMDYDKEDDYYYVRHSIFHASKVLQNTGIVKFTLDDTKYS